MLVKKSTGQFIFTATSVIFVESNRHRPAARLDIILGISPSGVNPFTELDVLYLQTNFIFCGRYPTHIAYSWSLFWGTLSHETAWPNCFYVSKRGYPLFHRTNRLARLRFRIPLLSDKRRSNGFYIDMASTHADFVCRTLQWVKGPDGIRGTAVL